MYKKIHQSNTNQKKAGNANNIKKNRLKELKDPGRLHSGALVLFMSVYVYLHSIQMNRRKASLDRKNVTELCDGKKSGQWDGTL